MRIIVADDEFFVRYSLISMLQEVIPHEIEVLEAENGEELVELINRKIPDVVFLDIKMPKMNGLEAFSILGERTPDTQWIIVSGYADFEYARQALSLGARDYLMKPVNIVDLKQLMDKMKMEWIEKRRRKVKLFSTDINLWMWQMEQGSRWEQTVFCGTILCEPFMERSSEIRRKNRQYRSFLKEKCEEFLEENLLHGLILLPEGNLTLISAQKKEGSSDYKEIEEVHKRILTLFQEEFRDESIPVLLSTGICEGIQDLEQSLTELTEYTSYAILCESGKHSSLVQMRKMKEKHEKILNFCNGAQMIGYAFQEKDYGKYVNCVKSADKILQEEGFYLSSSMKKNLTGFWRNLFQDEKLSENDWWNLNYLLKAGEDRLLERRSGGNGKSTVDKVIDYLQENYHQNISVGELAELFSITPNYLSALFKNETKQSLVQYLTDIRLQRAKELLINPENKINYIAETVGFRNGAYFARVFKNNIGIDPTEYRKKHSQDLHS